jgi:hypothetical protein
VSDDYVTLNQLRSASDYVTGIVTTVHTRAGHSFVFAYAVARPDPDPDVSASIVSETAINTVLEDTNDAIIDLARERGLL